MNSPSLPQGYKNAVRLHLRLQKKSESAWIRSGQKRALDQFHAMSESVPAYKDFLYKRKIKVSSVQSIKDFAKLPLIDKDNYLRTYPRKDLCWGGKFAKQSWVISTTSGSTGEPYYFPRTDLQDDYLAITTELYLRSNFSIQSKTTLYIDAFPMGAWIGGVFTYESIKKIAEKYYSISIITPGINKQEVINAVKQLGHEFDQIIIGAYAPFLKDILDDGARQGIQWENYNTGFIFSAEGFTEAFRNYVLRVSGADDPLRATLNHYGTVDLGTMAHETPLTIMIRRLLVQENKLNIVFPETIRQPTFAQFNPELFYFECEKDKLICTSYSGIPLVRYDLKDYGGVISLQEISDALHKNGFELDSHITENGIKDTVWNLPFVYIYERNDFSISYYAFLIYPDMVRRSLQVEKFQAKITGKFTMLVDYDNSGRQRLNVHIELKHGVAASGALRKQLGDNIHNSLLQESSEYREVSQMIGKTVMPIIHLWPYEDSAYFPSGTKQKWVLKQENIKKGK